MQAGKFIVLISHKKKPATTKWVAGFEKT